MGGEVMNRRQIIGLSIFSLFVGKPAFAKETNEIILTQGSVFDLDKVNIKSNQLVFFETSGDMSHKPAVIKSKRKIENVKDQLEIDVNAKFYLKFENDIQSWKIYFTS